MRTKVKVGAISNVYASQVTREGDAEEEQRVDSFILKAEKSSIDDERAEEIRSNTSLRQT
jgi:hypothetical protein